MKTCHPIRSFSLAAALLLSALPVQAVAPIALPSAPLYLAGGVAPNLVVTLDDSGSMAWAYVPDSLFQYKTTRRYRSNTFNALAYNPEAVYLPPLKADGTPYATKFAGAFINGFDQSRGSVNLSSEYKATVSYDPSQKSQTTANHPDGTTTGTAAYYYVYDPVSTGCSPAATTDDACYAKAVVGPDEQQNFANWYSFYRTRNLATVSAATRAFNNLPDTMRLAWQGLTTCYSFGSATCTGWDGKSYDHLIRTLSAPGHKQNFYDWLVKLPASSYTPLRAALGRVGEYYSTASGINNPYAQDPQVDVGTQYSCRANYSIMMTDGMWNFNAASKVSDSDNVDGTGKSLPDGTAYPPSPASPYADNNSGSLADVAFYYWAKDLRTDLTNNVPRNPRSLDKLVEDGKTIAPADYFDAKNDPASWQHMVTFTVGLGLTSSLSEVGLTWAGDTYQGSYADLVSGVKSWPKTDDNQPGNVADLWHAAINGRGLFFSAEDPQTLSDAMQEVVNNIISRSSSAASIATNSRRLDTSTNIYQASFDSGNWTGELEAFSIKADGSLGSSLWTASSRIPVAAARNIKTFNGTAGADFAWGSLSAAQQTALGSSADVLNYLRGDQSKEQSMGGPFRNRASLLGDIVNSDPLFVSEENFGYDKLAGTEGTDYVTYMAGKSAKNPMIYVGANDGMLHAFSAKMGWADTDLAVDSDGDGNKTNDKNESVATADSGKELFAYVPALVYANLGELTKPGYGNNHKYFVDGAPTVGDVYYGGATWKTVLVTPLGAGGRGVFALDISKDYATSAFAATDVLWEFDGSSIVSTADDMGYPVGSAAIGRFNDGKYYAIFGNGYGSAHCRSALYMVQIDAPSNVKFFDTGKGDCSSNATQNGMSTPSLVDYDGDRIIDAIFAGDLLGNLWKFDVSSVTWKIALGGQPMFTTASGQPITAPVEVGPSPSGASGKAMVYFGTGRYLLSGDETSKTVQTFYGLLDEDKVVTSLNKQSIGYEDANARVVFDGNDGTVNWKSQQGWYLDLISPVNGAEGERVLSPPLLRYGRVIFNTSIPSADPCVLGGTGWLMELEAATGSTLSYSALDMNDDGLFDEKDHVVIGKDNKGNDIKSPVAGKKSGSMSLNQPTVITAGAKEFKFNSDIKKGISVTTEKSGTSNPRSSWRQLQ